MNKDLIDKKAAIAAIEEIRVCIWEVDIPSPTVPEYMEHHIQMQRLMDKCDLLKTGLVNLPPADAVEVVRCIDCRHWKRETDVIGIECEPGETAHYCELDSMICRSGDFCSYGERKDDE